MGERLIRIGACAPSNIALIKYMGKLEGVPGNLPENGSLSMTLDDLCTFAEISMEPSERSTFQWVPELPRLKLMESRLERAGMTASVPTLHSEGLEKVIRHLKRVREECSLFFGEFGLVPKKSENAYVLRTSNTFPQASGIASSASSFAAITLAMAFACADDGSVFDKIYCERPEFRRQLAGVSRMGSGSSCRSFEGPFVFWQGEETHAVSSALPELAHFVLVVSDSVKRVSSSQAHSRVKSSPLWAGRVARVEARLTELRSALEKGDMKSIARISWSEAWEMHSLFHTSAEPFSYWEAGTMDALQYLAPSLQEEHPPIVTLDAGPNVHLIVEARFAQSWHERLRARFPGVLLLEDHPGQGAFCWKEGGLDSIASSIGTREMNR